MKQLHQFVIIVIVAAVLSALIAYSIGKSAHLNATVIRNITAQKAKADAEYQATLQQIEANKTQLARLDNFEAKVKSLEASIAEKGQESSSLNSDISAKRQELASLTRGIVRAKAAPTIIPAGQHTVGGYIRPGRYSVTGRSNFVVRSNDGSLKVNTILGGGDFGVDSYVCNLDEGDSIEAESRTKLTPLE